MATDSDSDGWGCEFFYTEPTKEVPVKRYMHVRIRDCCMECVAPTPRVPEMVFPVTPRTTSDAGHHNSHADELVKVPVDEVINSMSFTTPVNYDAEAELVQEKGGSVCGTGCHGKDIDNKDNDNSAGQPITHQENPPQVSQ